MNSMEQKVIKPKLGLLELAKQLGSVSQACKVMGYSRDSLPVQGTVRDWRRRSADGHQQEETASS